MPKGMHKAMSQKSGPDPNAIKNPEVQFDPFAAQALLPLSERIAMKKAIDKKKSQSWDELWEAKKVASASLL